MTTVQTPDWVKHAVFYQIFPDRFARSPRTQHPRGITFKPWGTPPSEQGYQGGDLYGIVDRLDYLQDLGITALYLNPVFMSASNHRYHTYDYMVVDPLLGGDAALRALIDAAHARDIRIVRSFSGRLIAFDHAANSRSMRRLASGLSVSSCKRGPVPTTSLASVSTIPRA